MKKVLILTYYWPPAGGAGVQRWLKFTKYLRDFGWEPVIFTAEHASNTVMDDGLAGEIPAGVEVLRLPAWEPHAAYNKLMGRPAGDAANSGGLEDGTGLRAEVSRWIRGNLFIPDARCFWIRPAHRFLVKWLARNRVDAIATTGPPHSVHLIGRALKRQFDIPWLADFRDPWTKVFYNQQFHISALARCWNERLERSVLAEADIVTTAGWSMKNEFRKIQSRQYEVLTNGFDPDDFSTDNVAIDEKFTLTYIGTFMASQNHLSLWRVLRRMCDASKDFAQSLIVQITGRYDQSVFDAICSNGLQKQLRLTPYIPHSEVTGEMQRAAVLLLMINKGPAGKGILTGKLFEYLAAGRPVLCLGPLNGDAARVITSANAGYVVDPEDEAALEARLHELYERHRAGTPYVEATEIKTYSRIELTGRLAALFDRMAASSTQPDTTTTEITPTI